MMRLPPERPGHPAPDVLAAARAASAQAIAQRRWRVQRPLAEAMLGGVPVLHVQPASCAAKARVLHFHGGGFRLGLPEMDAPFAEALADACGVEVILPRYRLAPEAPFPAGLADGWAVFSALPDDLPLVLMGASAGGGLAAGVAALAGQDGRRPAGLVLLSAWLDLMVEARAYAANAGSDPLFSRESALAANALYLQGHDPRDPLASPIFADSALFPATLVTAGSGEVLADDARAFHQLLQGAAVPSRLLLVDGMDHVAVTRSPDATGAAECFAAIVQFLGDLLQP